VFVRLAQWVGGLGLLGFIAIAVLGYRLEGIGDQQMPRHYIGGLLAVLPVLLIDAWAAVYLLASARIARRLVETHRVDPRPALRAQHLARHLPPWLLAAAALALAAVLTGGLAFTAHLPAWVHHFVVLLALGVQGWALWRLRGVFALHSAAFAELDREVGERERRTAPTAAIASSPGHRP
jgi:hypothetical protein